MVQRAPAKKLAGALLSRGYRIGRPQLRVGGISNTRLLFCLHYDALCQTLDSVSCLS